MGRLARFIHFYTDEDDGGETEPVWATASGAIASFTTPFAYPLKKLVAQINPVQDLHGYENPWPAGGGKNQLKNTLTTSTQGGITATVDELGVITLNGTATTSVTFSISSDVGIGAGTYIISGISGGSQSTYKLEARVDGQWGKNIVDGYLQVTASTGITNLALVAYSGTSLSNVKIYPMICLPTATDPTVFAPYENICPITGWTGVSGQRTGKNLLSYAPQYQDAVSSMSLDKSIATLVKEGESYHYSFDSVSNATTWRICFILWDKDGNRLQESSGDINAMTAVSVSGIQMYANGAGTQNVYYVEGANGSKKDATLVFNQDCYVLFFFRFGDTGSTSVAVNAQLELGSTASPYEEYTSEAISVTFPSTVYGGSDDVIGGQGTSTMAKDTISITSIYAVSANPVCDFGVFSISNNFKAPLVYKGSATVKGNGGWSTTSAIGEVIVYSSESNQLAVSVPKGSTLADAKALFDGTDALYELATPATFTHEGQSVDTLVGQNNVFVDTGDVSVTYQASIKGYIDKVLGA